MAKKFKEGGRGLKKFKEAQKTNMQSERAREGEEAESLGRISEKFGNKSEFTVGQMVEGGSERVKKQKEGKEGQRR